MAKYKSVYMWEVFSKLNEGEVYILDKQEHTVLKASDMAAGALSTIMNVKDKGNRFEAWVEESEGDNE